MFKLIDHGVAGLPSDRVENSGNRQQFLKVPFVVSVVELFYLIGRYIHPDHPQAGSLFVSHKPSLWCEPANPSTYGRLLAYQVYES